MIILLLALTASAGSLGEGVFGRPWHSEMRMRDIGECRFLASRDVVQLLISLCPTPIGGSVYTTSFLYFDNALYGAIAIAEDKKSCIELKESSLIAWGPGAPSNPKMMGELDGWSWNYPTNGPEYTASFSWDGSACSLGIRHVASVKKVGDITEAANKK